MKKLRSLTLLALILLMIPTTISHALQEDEPDIVIPPRFVCPDDFDGFMTPTVEVGLAGVQVILVEFEENLLRFPTTSAPALEALAEDTSIDEIIAGPACSDGYVWWYVRVGELEGWTPESTAESELYCL